MSKILVLGAIPLPIENAKILSGPGIRTWQFVKPLLDEGHQVLLLCSQSEDNGAYKQEEKQNLIYLTLPKKEFQDLAHIQKIHDNFQPDCIFSISSFFPSYQAVNLKTDKPIWFDRGDLMAEAQLKSTIENNDSCLYDYWKLEESILARGDIFSTVSSPQKFSLVGKLGAIGRLNKYTLGYEFIHIVPCAAEEGNYTHTKDVIRDKYAGKDDFVILWSGGYNTWSDTDTLFSALEIAMVKNEKIKFVSTGAAIPGQDEVTYQRFLKLISSSQYKDRYIMLGWVSTADLPNFYLESNLGINIDKYCYEVMLGSRHRLLDWIKADLPILTTKPSEFTQLLDEKKMIFTYPHNNPELLAKAILELSYDREKLLEYAQRAKKFIQEKFSYKLTTESFKKWVANPKSAPDSLVRGKVIHDIGLQYTASFKAKIDSLNIDCANLKEHIVNLEGQVSNFESERKGTEIHLKKLEGVLQNLKQHIANLEGERNLLLKRIDKITSTFVYKVYSFIKSPWRKNQ